MSNQGLAHRNTVSIVITTLNSRRGLDECLTSVREQDFPRDLIEVIVVDGGSNDGTIELAKSFGARVVHDRSGRPEAATFLGFSVANGELIASIASDNVLPNTTWLGRMVQPFDDEGLFAAQTMWYQYSPTDSVVNRYSSLWGASDPIPIYLHKQDRAKWIDRRWGLMGAAEDKGNYYVIDFEPESTPTLGANGYIVRSRVIRKVMTRPEEFFHIDVNYDMICAGYKRLAVVKTSIWHRTGDSFLNFLRKRIRYGLLFVKDHKMRRYRYLHGKVDRRRLLLFLLFSMTVIEPTLQARKGYKQLPDRAWFLHPIMCLTFLLMYSVVWMPVLLRTGNGKA